MLKTIRKNSFVNFIIREPLRLFGEVSASLYGKITSRWPVSGDIVCHFDSDTFILHSKCDDGIASCFFYNNLYDESKDLRLFLAMAEHTDTVLDIGANTGLYSLLASKREPSSRIFSFEPYTTNADRFRKNIGLNGIKNVTLIQKAVGNNTSRLNFFVPEDDRLTYVSSANGEFSKGMYEEEIDWKSVEVEQVTIDSFVTEFNLKVGLLKIDVETYEMPVFEGMSNVLANHRPTILFESFIDSERISFFNKLASKNNYFIYAILNEGLLRLDTYMQPNEDGLNFILSPARLENLFTSYKKLPSLAQELMMR